MTEEEKTTDAVATIADVGPPSLSIDQLLALSVQRDSSPEAIEKLVHLKEHTMRVQAEMECNKALVAFQSEVPVIGHNQEAVIGGDYKYTYTDYTGLAAALRPYLKKHGLSYDQDQTINVKDSTVTVHTTVRHIGGHSFVKNFTSPVPKNVKVNDSQKSTMATTTAQRKGLAVAFGIVTGSDRDDDFASQTEPITEEQAIALEAMILETETDLDKFLQFAKADKVENIPDTKFTRLMNMLKQKQKQREGK